MDGAIFLWLDDLGRPAVAAQIFAWKDEGTVWNWRHEFISLAPGTLQGEREGRASWSPRRPGVEFHPVPGAPKPPESPGPRASQMKDLAREFRSSDNVKQEKWVELRLLPTPIARYGKAGSKVVDRALFAFVIGTDPEAFLFLEVRAGAGPRMAIRVRPDDLLRAEGDASGKGGLGQPVPRPGQRRGSVPAVFQPSRGIAPGDPARKLGIATPTTVACHMAVLCRGRGRPSTESTVMNARRGLRLGLGPVFAYERIASSRRWQAYLLRSLFAGMLLAALLVIWCKSVVPVGPVAFHDLARLGETFYIAVIGTQLTLVLLAAPAATAGAMP